MLAFFAFLIILSLIYLLLKDKLCPMVALSIVPLVGLLSFWVLSALLGHKAIPNNYAYMLKTSYQRNYLKEVAHQNAYAFPDGKILYQFEQAGFKAIHLKPHAKDLSVDAQEVLKFYSAGLAAAYPHATHKAFIYLQRALGAHGFWDSVHDHAQVLVRYFRYGFNKVSHIAIMFIFAILFFGVLNDVGLFNPMMGLIIKLSRGNVIAICMGTCLIATIAHLDGSGASTFLVVIPPLLPIYRQLNMNPYLLLLLVASSAGMANMLPWGGPLLRIASVMGADAATLYFPLIKVQLIGLACVLGMAFWLGLREQVRLKNPTTIAHHQSLYTDVPSPANPSHSQHFFANLCVAVCALVFVILGTFPPEFCFIVALCVVLLINYKTPKERVAKIKAYAPEAISMAVILLAAGIYIGVLSGSGMLAEVANQIATLLPDVSLKHLHLIAAILGVPLKLLLDTNGYYFTLLPVVSQIVSQHGVDAQSCGYAMLIGSIAGTFVSPFAPALWLGIGLARLSMGRHIAYSLFYLWGLSLVVLALSYAFGVFQA